MFVVTSAVQLASSCHVSVLLLLLGVALFVGGIALIRWARGPATDEAEVISSCCFGIVVMLGGILLMVTILSRKQGFCASY